MKDLLNGSLCLLLSASSLFLVQEIFESCPLAEAPIVRYPKGAWALLRPDSQMKQMQDYQGPFRLMWEPTKS